MKSKDGECEEEMEMRKEKRNGKKKKKRMLSFSLSLLACGPTEKKRHWESGRGEKNTHSETSQGRKGDGQRERKRAKVLKKCEEKKSRFILGRASMYYYIVQRTSSTNCSTCTLHAKDATGARFGP